MAWASPSWGERLERWIAGHSRERIGLACVLIILFIGYVDFATGTQVTLSVIYAFPIAVMALFVGGWSAIGLSVFSVLVWIVSDSAAGMKWPALFVPLVNGLLRLLFYAFLVFVLTRLRQLQTGLEIRVQERARALRRETAERERLEQEMLEISEREQRRIGQDLHDGLCQHLTGTALAAHVLAEKLGARDLHESEAAHRIVDLVEEAISLARGMAKGLYPVELQADGLMQALEHFTATTTELFGVACRFECATPVLIHSPATATHLYRIAQEAVGNAVKHGQARHVTVALEENDDGIRLSISDDGRGLAKDAADGKGMGLRIMADRAKMVGGIFSVTHRFKGVELICLIPQASGPHMKVPESKVPEMEVDR
ncbi:MAG TPA: sensor histidine kinase [Rhizomicrobium sp.]|nr:sensor histidine kinase [Rhizomicrobium sp.]